MPLLKQQDIAFVVSIDCLKPTQVKSMAINIIFVL